MTGRVYNGEDGESQLPSLVEGALQQGGRHDVGSARRDVGCNLELEFSLKLKLPDWFSPRA